MAKKCAVEVNAFDYPAPVSRLLLASLLSLELIAGPTLAGARTSCWCRSLSGLEWQFFRNAIAQEEFCQCCSACLAGDAAQPHTALSASLSALSLRLRLRQSVTMAPSLVPASLS